MRAQSRTQSDDLHRNATAEVEAAAQHNAPDLIIAKRNDIY